MEGGSVGGSKEVAGYSSTVLKSYCIFCATECPPNFVTVEGKIVPMKEEKGEAPNGEIVLMERQLRVMFIIKNILQVKKKACVKIFQDYGEQFNPEFWLNVCFICKALVEKVYAKECEIQKLERMVKEIKQTLKSMIIDTSTDDSPFMEVKEDAQLSIMKIIREDAIRGSTFQNKPSKIEVTMHSVPKEPAMCPASTSSASSSRKRQSKTTTSSSAKRPRKVYYKCEQCHALIKGSDKNVDQHILLHLNGDGELCKQCGWRLEAGSLMRHLTTWHNAATVPNTTGANVAIRPLSAWAKNESKATSPKPKPTAPPDKLKYSHKCEECGALLKTKKRLDLHTESHKVQNIASVPEVATQPMPKLTPPRKRCASKPPDAARVSQVRVPAPTRSRVSSRHEKMDWVPKNEKKLLEQLANCPLRKNPPRSRSRTSQTEADCGRLLPSSKFEKHLSNLCTHSQLSQKRPATPILQSTSKQNIITAAALPVKFFICSRCQKMFQTWKILQKHVQVIHSCSA